MKHLTPRNTLGVAALLCGVALGGCADTSITPAAKAPGDAAAAQLKTIENNPNMPEAQKQAVRARLEQEKKAGEAATNASKPGPTKS